MAWRCKNWKENASSALFTATLVVQSLVIGLEQIIIHSAESLPSSQYAARPPPPARRHSVCVHFFTVASGAQKGIICGRSRSISHHTGDAFSRCFEYGGALFISLVSTHSARLFTGAGNKYRLHLARGSCLQRRLGGWVHRCSWAETPEKDEILPHLGELSRKERQKGASEGASLQRRPPMQISANLMPGQIKRTRSANTFWGLQLRRGFFCIAERGDTDTRALDWQLVCEMSFFTKANWHSRYRM